MRRLRDVFYINANFDQGHYMYYGMEFKEFILHCPVEIDNILVTDSRCYVVKGYNNHWNLEVTEGKNEIIELSHEDLYGMGNFYWLDYKDETALNACTPQEQAEVLYMSHFGKPLTTPFVERLQNNFVYQAHDDGWFCKLCCKDMTVMKDIMANKIAEHFATNKRMKINPMDEENKQILLDMTINGLLVDLSDIYVGTRGYRCVNIYAIGKFEDMDAMYNNLDKHKARASKQGYLEYSNKKWKIVFI